MFKSRTHPRIFTQYEHGRLSGTLALLWGNDAFDLPPLPFQPFVEGITLHDWGYGVVDNVPIGEAAEADWLALIRRGADMRYPHPVTDLIVKRHLHRLLLLDPTTARLALAAELEQAITSRLDQSGVSEKALVQADKITALCDMVSFDFCFETPRQRTLPIFDRQHAADPIEISWRTQVDGPVTMSPWPFRVPIITTTVIAFDQTNYPETLKPIVVPFTLKPSSN